jgi:hypothetical protein
LAAAEPEHGRSVDRSAGVHPEESGDEKRGRAADQLDRLAHGIERGLEAVASDQETIRTQAKEVAKGAATLEVVKGTSDHRPKQFATLRAEYQASADEYQHPLGKMMASFEPGLFVGGDRVDWPHDHLDLERWFRQPQSHERRSHGRSHAGGRIVQEGPTVVLVLDAH